MTRHKAEERDVDLAHTFPSMVQIPTNVNDFLLLKQYVSTIWTTTTDLG
jgi:hypothetical protein